MNTCINFARSFLYSNGSKMAQNGRPLNAGNVRFWAESVLHNCDDTNGTSKNNYQCGSCKAENTFDAKGHGDPFKQPNYDYMPVLHGDDILTFRRGACCDTREDKM